MTNKRIDYGRGITNIDTKTGIRYGVIPGTYAIGEAWEAESECDYGEPHCPKCGNDVIPCDTRDYYCVKCNECFWSDQCFPEEAGTFVDTDELVAESDSNGDIWIFKSKYYTKSQFCSPCAPGAGYLLNYCEEGEKTYCLSADWFDESIQPCPYPYWSVADDSLVYEPKKEVESC